MVLEQGHDTPAHGATCVFWWRVLWQDWCGCGEACGAHWGLWAGGRHRAGHVEEALILLVHLCQELEQLCLTFVCRLCQLCLTLMHPLCQQCLTLAGGGEFPLEHINKAL